MIETPTEILAHHANNENAMGGRIEQDHRHT
jgi:hypothetical protein